VTSSAGQRAERGAEAVAVLLRGWGEMPMAAAIEALLLSARASRAAASRMWREFNAARQEAARMVEMLDGTGAPVAEDIALLRAMAEGWPEGYPDPARPAITGPALSRLQRAGLIHVETDNRDSAGRPLGTLITVTAEGRVAAGVPA
jgi:hypothetical protein